MRENVAALNLVRLQSRITFHVSLITSIFLPRVTAPSPHRPTIAPFCRDRTREKDSAA
jgi:hypothetical protein